MGVMSVVENSSIPCALNVSASGGFQRPEQRLLKLQHLFGSQFSPILPIQDVQILRNAPQPIDSLSSQITDRTILSPGLAFGRSHRCVVMKTPFQGHERERTHYGVSQHQTAHPQSG